MKKNYLRFVASIVFLFVVLTVPVFAKTSVIDNGCKSEHSEEYSNPDTNPEDWKTYWDSRNSKLLFVPRHSGINIDYSKMKYHWFSEKDISAYEYEI